MFPLKTLILEDDSDDLIDLENLLLDYKDIINIACVATTFEEAAKVLAVQKFDLSILDFNLDENKDLYDLIEVVGVSNMGIMALHTIEKGSYDDAQKLDNPIYLGKPYSAIKIPTFIKKVVDEAKKRQADIPCRHIIIEAKNSKRIEIPCSKIVLITKSSKINDTLKNDLIIYYQNNSSDIAYEEISRTTLDDFYSRLDKSKFYRTQKSFIVNTEHIVGCNPASLDLYLAIPIKDMHVKYSEEFPEIIAFLNGRGLLK